VKQVLERQEFDDVGEISNERACELCQELSEALKQIYGEFVNDLRMRKSKRMSSDTPLEQVQEYKLVVQSNYRRQYAAKVSSLVSADYGEGAFNQLRDNILIFVKALREEVIEVVSPPLRVKVLQDAYHTLKNASEEVGKIVKVLFFYEREINCENLNKFHFYEHVVKEVKRSLETSSETLDELNAAQDLNLELLGLFVNEPASVQASMTSGVGASRMLCSEPQLNFSAFQDNKVWELNDVSDSDDEEANPAQLELFRMSIDELIVFIEDSPPSRSSKKKRGKRDTSTRSSSPKETVEDSEFEALLARLRSVKPAVNKVRPNFRQEWLQSLRSDHQKSSRN
jgi:hypothetical protein